MRTMQMIVGRLLIIATFFPAILSPLTGKAQRPADAMPEGGWWQVITNETGKERALVQFYDLDRHLLYEERLSGVTIDLSRKKTRRALNGTLRTALLAWKEKKQLPDNVFVQRMAPSSVQ